MRHKKLCECGCGEMVKHRFVSGHNLKLDNSSFNPESIKKRSRSLKKKYKTDKKYRKHMAKIKTKRNKDPKFRKLVAKRAKERWANPKFKAKMSKIAKVKQAAANRTPEKRKAISKGLKQYYKDNPEARLNIRFSENCYKALKKKWEDPDFRRKMRHSHNGFDQGWVSTLKGRPTKIFLQSSWEKMFVKMLDNCTVVKYFIYEPFGITYYKKDAAHKYYPDFLVRMVDGTKWVVEIKGWVGKEAKKKFAAAEIYCRKRGYEFCAITEKPTKPLTEYLQ